MILGKINVEKGDHYVLDCFFRGLSGLPVKLAIA